LLAFPPRPLRWLFLDLNSYFASVEQQLDPALRGKPVIVAPVDADTTVAVAASVEAKRYGISTGTPVWEAKRKCRDLLIARARHEKYVEFHEAILAEVWRHIPVTHVCSIDEVACRLLDNENSPEAAVALARRIKAGIRANIGECLTSSVGIAPNRLLAKLASDLQKPDGLVVFTADQLPHRLYDLKLREIAGIGAKMERRLAQDGILDIRQLCERRPRDAGICSTASSCPKSPPRAVRSATATSSAPASAIWSRPASLRAASRSRRRAGCAAKAIAAGCSCSTASSRTTSPIGAPRSSCRTRRTAS
jgi:DNA polymerase-4